MGDVNKIYRGQASLDLANLEIKFRIFPLLFWRLTVSIYDLGLFYKKKQCVLCHPQCLSFYALTILLRHLDTFELYVPSFSLMELLCQIAF